MGYYCVNGSGDPTKCPVGTFSNRTLVEAKEDCLKCPGGWYCEIEGLITPTGLCSEGYYCPLGSSQRQPAATPCPIGNFCPEGSAAPIPCRNNSHVNHTHAVQCYNCPAGYYCVRQGSSELCPKGYYCPAGTGLNWQACPRGTFSDVEGLYERSQCKQCLPGKYCDGEHLSAPSGDCGEGHYCAYGVDQKYPTGVNQTGPFNNSCYDDREIGTGGICPVGHYCPLGSSDITPCANGTYTNKPGSAACNLCPQGYWCPFGAINYTDYPCPKGYYCPAGTKWVNDNPCPIGTFNNRTMRFKLDHCLACPGGEYCDSEALSRTTGTCSPGYYCIINSTTATPSGGYMGDICKSGYYCPGGSDRPLPCNPGHYCANDGLNDTSGPCAPGYYCTTKAKIANPMDGNVTGDICPMGTYCPQGSVAPVLCQIGTFLNGTGNDETTDCLTCTAGSFCKGSGMILNDCLFERLCYYFDSFLTGNIIPDGPCAAGWYCPPGQNDPRPAGLNCTRGHYCPEGSADPIRCASGKYQDELGAVTCKTCPAGYYCDSTFDPVVLYNNSYCPKGKKYLFNKNIFLNFFYKQGITVHLELNLLKNSHVLSLLT